MLNPITTCFQQDSLTMRNIKSTAAMVASSNPRFPNHNLICPGRVFLPAADSLGRSVMPIPLTHSLPRVHAAVPPVEQVQDPPQRRRVHGVAQEDERPSQEEVGGILVERKQVGVYRRKTASSKA